VAPFGVLEQARDQNYHILFLRRRSSDRVNHLLWARSFASLRQHLEVQHQHIISMAAGPTAAACMERRASSSCRPSSCGFLVLLLLASATISIKAAPLQLAIWNQVWFHLEVVAGAMHVLGDFSSAPLTIYLNERVMKTDWYGFKSWMGKRQGVIWKDCKEYDGKTQYDLVWFISPEYHLPYIAQVTAQMKPKVGLYMVHNGHIPLEEIRKVEDLAKGTAILSLAPHVANFVGNRTSLPTEWILPIFPYLPANVCALHDLTVSGRGQWT
jgi:hypothetical protein